MRILPRPRRSAALFAFIFIAVLFLTSFAGRQCSFLMDQNDLRQHREIAIAEEKEAVPIVRARMLNVKTNDYGSYDPSPSMEKPHFKLIPN